MSGLALSEIMRVIQRMVIIGTVVEFDPAKAKARVSLGPGVVSGWLAIAQMGSKDVRLWIPPVVGSQVIVFSPGGDTARGVIYPGPYDGEAPDDRASSIRLSMPGVDIAVDGGVATVSLTTMNLTGDLIVDGDVIASGISLVDHTHGGVQSGGSSTAPPS